MNEDTTRDLPDSRSFEERIFDYLEAMEARITARMKAETLEMKIVINDINRRLTTLEDKVERRLYDTRPIWEGVQAQLTALQEQVNGLQEQVGGLQIQFGEMQTQLDGIEIRVVKLDAKIEAVHDEWLDIKTDNKMINKRLTRIEDAQPQVPS